MATEISLPSYEVISLGFEGQIPFHIISKSEKLVRPGERKREGGGAKIVPPRTCPTCSSKLLTLNLRYTLLRYEVPRNLTFEKTLYEESYEAW